MNTRFTRFLGVVTTLFLAVSFSACATFGGGNGADDALEERAARAQCEDGEVLAEEGALYVQGKNRNWVTVNIYLRDEGATMPRRVESNVSTNQSFGPEKVHGISPTGGVFLVIDPVGGARSVQHPFRLESDAGGRATLMTITIGTDGVTQFAHSNVQTYPITCVEASD